jgi:hypothetical protein
VPTCPPLPLSAAGVPALGSAALVLPAVLALFARGAAAAGAPASAAAVVVGCAGLGVAAAVVAPSAPLGLMLG